LKASGKKRFCGGVDVGGTKISAALFTEKGAMLSRKKISSDKEGGDRVADQVVDIIRELEEAARNERGRLAAVGVCIPGVVYHDTGVVWVPNIAGWDHYHLRHRIRWKVSLSIVIDSDRSAYVLGEQWCGAAKGVKNVVFLAVGTGIGAGLLIDGRICRGSEDIAGAVGWFALNPDFKQEYAEMGSFEAEASGNSVGRRARALLRSGKLSLMRQMVKGKIEDITAQTVVTAARREDPLSQEVIDTTVHYLAMGIANIVSMLNPEMIVLGGGLFQAGDIFLQPLRADFKKWAQPLAAKTVRIELSRLGEDAGLYGAGKLAWESIRKQGGKIRLVLK
jgi:glucokinase